MFHGEGERGQCCRRQGGRVRGFIQPWLLLQVARQPAHGYELMESLAQQEDQPALDPGTMYRTLRLLEEDGLVSSRWETGGSGPARRVYEVTAQGLEYLHVWAATIRRERARLDRFLVECESYLRTTD